MTDAKFSRQNRQSLALRENLKRRKAQAKARSTDSATGKTTNQATGQCGEIFSIGSEDGTEPASQPVSRLPKN